MIATGQKLNIIHVQLIQGNFYQQPVSDHTLQVAQVGFKDIQFTVARLSSHLRVEFSVTRVETKVTGQKSHH